MEIARAFVQHVHRPTAGAAEPPGFTLSNTSTLNAKVLPHGLGNRQDPALQYSITARLANNAAENRDRTFSLNMSKSIILLTQLAKLRTNCGSLFPSSKPLMQLHPQIQVLQTTPENIGIVLHALALVCSIPGTVKLEVPQLLLRCRSCGPLGDFDVNSFQGLGIGQCCFAR